VTLGKDYASVGAQKKFQKQEPDVNKEMSAAGGRNGVTIMRYYMEKPIITGERKKKKKKENERDVFVEENKIVLMLVEIESPFKRTGVLNSFEKSLRFSYIYFI
jgi:hypothetical protein